MRQLAPVIIPLGRPAMPEDAAGPIFFLCSPWSNFVHGQVITASGGQTTGMTSLTRRPDCRQPETCAPSPLTRTAVVDLARRRFD